MKNFTEQELTAYTGKEGKSAYICHDGKIFDVSQSKVWREGVHMRRHNAGTDLTLEIQAAPHDSSVLARYPQVGVLVKEQAPLMQPMPGWLAWLMESNPFFRRHPHPMTVHFPIVFMLCNPFFNLLFLLTGNRAFETTAFHCLCGGAVFMVVAMITGFFTWWYNYMAKKMRAVDVKIPASILTLVLAIGAFIWRWRVPDVMLHLQGINIFYLLCSLAFIPLIIVIGWYGATLTFPVEKK